jgi:hypothetical protein
MVREGSSSPKSQRPTDGVGTNAPSIITGPRPQSCYDVDPCSVAWCGGPSDIRKCTKAMTMTGRDGTKLELWARWLRLPQRISRPVRTKQWTEDDSEDLSGTSTNPPLSPSASSIILALEIPSLEQVKLLLHNHGTDILQLFTYPDSRASFLQMLESAGLREELNADLDPELQFWSYNPQASTTSLECDASPLNAGNASREETPAKSRYPQSGADTHPHKLPQEDVDRSGEEFQSQSDAAADLDSVPSPTNEELQNAVARLLAKDSS